MSAKMHQGISSEQLLLLILATAVLTSVGFAAKDALLGRGKARACVVDIDQTITDGRFQRRMRNKIPLGEAKDVLRRIESMDIKIFYVSERPEWKLLQTTIWLATRGFPLGQTIIHQRNDGEAGYKLREIREIKKSYDILFGFGNLDDAVIYLQAGIPAWCRDRWRNEDWVEVDDNLNAVLDHE